jgi:hypothetical protein
MIPPNHGKDFTAAMTVVYVRDEQQTIVQETLTGAIRENNVALTGISYSFVEQGTARTYGLDAFELTVPSGEGTMSGIAVLKNGRRPVIFRRTTNGKVQ